MSLMSVSSQLSTHWPVSNRGTEGDCSQTIMQAIMQTSCKQGGMEALLRALD